MKKEFVIDLNTYELEDLMVNAIMYRCYPERIKDEIELLQKIILIQLKEWENYNSLDIVNTRYFLEETTKSGKKNRIELYWDCYMLSDFLDHYLEKYTKELPDSVWKKIEELKDELDKYTPDNEEYLDEDSDINYIQEMEYEEPRK